MTTVHILLATYNGTPFLSEQLASLSRQTHTAWTLTISDDDSTDTTLDIVNQFANQVPQRVTLLHGPKRGSTHNFFHLIQHAQLGNPHDLFAFCDQDDVWLDDKLSRAVQWHTSQPDHPVRLYCGRTQFVDEQLTPIGLSPNIQRPPSFGNALVQNIASGNTMVMSASVLNALQQIKPHHSVWHDWTAYLAATALGGIVMFDETHCLLYRQHSRNVIGSNYGIKAQLKRFIPLWQRRYKHWSDMTESAIADIIDQLPPNTANTFASFQRMRSAKNILERLIIFQRSGIRRQGIASNCTLVLALLFGLV
jgi:glycosyltransferase involved in cell wall biosynthesis